MFWCKLIDVFCKHCQIVFLGWLKLKLYLIENLHFLSGIFLLSFSLISIQRKICLNLHGAHFWRGHLELQQDKESWAKAQLPKWRVFKKFCKIKSMENIAKFWKFLPFLKTKNCENFPKFVRDAVPIERIFYNFFHFPLSL